MEGQQLSSSERFKRARELAEKKYGSNVLHSADIQSLDSADLEVLCQFKTKVSEWEEESSKLNFTLGVRKHHDTEY